MNAQQRRKAYRNIDRMVGKTVYMPERKNDPRPLKATVTGRTRKAQELGSYRGFSTRPSVHRVQVRTESGAIFNPRISLLEWAK